MGNVILDVFLVALLAIGIWQGWRRGFVLIVLKTFSGLFSLVIAFLFFKDFSVGINEKYVFPFINGKIDEAVMNAAANGAGTAEELAGAIPSGLQAVASVVGIDLNTAAENAVDKGINAAEEFVRSASVSVSQFVSMVAAFAILAVLSRIFLRVFAVLLDELLVKIPVVNTVNSVLGLIFGLLTSLILAWIFVQLLAFLAETLDFSFLTMDQTMIAGIFYRFHPLEWLLR